MARITLDNCKVEWDQIIQDWNEFHKWRITALSEYQSTIDIEKKENLQNECKRKFQSIKDKQAEHEEKYPDKLEDYDLA